jgi:hypothetical protein
LATIFSKLPKEKNWLTKLTRTDLNGNHNSHHVRSNVLLSCPKRDDCALNQELIFALPIRWSYTLSLHSNYINQRIREHKPKTYKQQKPSRRANVKTNKVINAMAKTN